MIALGTRDLRTSEPATALHLYSLGTSPRGRLHGALHRTAESDPLLQLVGDAVRYELSAQLSALAA
jgi:hypothetical protein